MPRQESLYSKALVLGWLMKMDNPEKTTELTDKYFTLGSKIQTQFTRGVVISKTVITTFCLLDGENFHFFSLLK